MTAHPPTIDDTPAPAAALRPVMVLVCSTCKGTGDAVCEGKPGAVLAETATRLIGEEADNGRIAVQSVECLGNCSRGCSAAILSPGDWHYVFGDLDADSAADLLVGARLMGSVAEGPLPWRGRPTSLKKGMIARIPPVEYPST
ncbi:DUF1636 family protein [Notoacmeibacter sp. MSK16QG-6]|uniref:DUF1636 family protein n=1 Tax=Notoacmeibacter sp. MSK16QG-6 TaxID=2957982 RepID=UPI00209E72E0|nr:DUF1636 family protein [Notoacmeibacter sp. MSK16QG-6]MCP1199022.1 DUF1636 family protein [Notoacmeibacter sp. MSK16QG-6]